MTALKSYIHRRICFVTKLCDKANGNGITQLGEHIGGLYLSNEFSDVKIAIGEVEIPAHRNILSQRCSYFKTMFASGMLESTAKRIKLRETPINGFKLILKWIYTGFIELDKVDNALEVLHLSHMYELTELETFAESHVATNCNDENFCLVFNSIILLPRSQNSVDDFIKRHFITILTHRTFPNLTRDALNAMLTKYVDDATNVEILSAFARWMQANTDKSEHFPGLLMLIPLNSINFGELLSIVPAELISANILADVAREQQVLYKTSSITNTNLVIPKYGAKVIIDNKNMYFSNRFIKGTTVDKKEVVIDLGQLFKLNALTVNPIKDCSLKTMDTLKVSISSDNSNWTKIYQQAFSVFFSYFFEKCTVRFIKISSAHPLSNIVDLSTLKAGYYPKMNSSTKISL